VWGGWGGGVGLRGSGLEGEVSPFVMVPGGRKKLINKKKILGGGGRTYD